MRSVYSLSACLAIAAQLLLAPWQHVHAHGHSGHHAQSPWHVHQVQQPAGAAWQTHGPDEDARSLSSPPGTVQVGGHPSPAVLTAVIDAARPACAGTASPGFESRSHDPPGPTPDSPRAPPSLAPSLT